MTENQPTSNPYQVDQLPKQRQLSLDEVQFQFAGRPSFFDLPIPFLAFGQWLILLLITWVAAAFLSRAPIPAYWLQASLCLIALAMLAHLHLAEFLGRWRQLRDRPELSEACRGTVDAHWISFSRNNGSLQIATPAIEDWQCKRNRITIKHPSLPTKSWDFVPRMFSGREFHRFLDWSITMDQYLKEKRIGRELKVAEPTLDHIQDPVIRLRGVPPGNNWAKLNRIPQLSLWRSSERIKSSLQFLTLLIFWTLWALGMYTAVAWLVGNLLLFSFGASYTYFAFQQTKDRGLVKFQVPIEIAVGENGVYGSHPNAIFFRGWPDFSGYYELDNVLLLQPRGTSGTFYLLQKSGSDSEQDWQQVKTLFNKNLQTLDVNDDE